MEPGRLLLAEAEEEEAAAEAASEAAAAEEAPAVAEAGCAPCTCSLLRAPLPPVYHWCPGRPRFLKLRKQF